MADSASTRINRPVRKDAKRPSLRARLQQEIATRTHAEQTLVTAERSLREVRDRFETSFTNAPIGMALIDVNGVMLQVNTALCRLSGYHEDELTARTLDAITHPDDVQIASDDHQQLLSGDISSYQAERRLRHAWGHYVWVLLTVSVVRDADSQARHLITQAQDISERKERSQQLEYLADHDFLTGLYNRRWFERELAREVERAGRYGTPGAVLIIDLDHFKDVNDALGHKTGDDLLKGVAGLLKHRARPADLGPQDRHDPQLRAPGAASRH
jgi:PAS domain S-box-containing protein